MLYAILCQVSNTKLEAVTTYIQPIGPQKLINTTSLQQREQCQDFLSKK